MCLRHRLWSAVYFVLYPSVARDHRLFPRRAGFIRQRNAVDDALQAVAAPAAPASWNRIQDAVSFADIRKDPGAACGCGHCRTHCLRQTTASRVTGGRRRSSPAIRHWRLAPGSGVARSNAIQQTITYGIPR